MFADYIGVKYAVSCFSGTSALMLLHQTLQLEKEDEIITQSLTFSAVGFAMKQSGVKIVFADCSESRFTLSFLPSKKNKTIYGPVARIPTDIPRDVTRAGHPAFGRSNRLSVRAKRVFWQHFIISTGRS